MTAVRASSACRVSHLDLRVLRPATGSWAIPSSAGTGGDRVSNASATIPTVSHSVGCGWIVKPIPAASAPISIACLQNIPISLLRALR